MGKEEVRGNIKKGRIYKEKRKGNKLLCRKIRIVKKLDGQER